MALKIHIIFFAILALLISCSNSKVSQLESRPREYQVGSYLWFQKSGEYRALCYQAYNLARYIVDNDIKNVKRVNRRAVVFDIDETILDGSKIGAYEIKNNLPWSQERFNKWVMDRKGVLIAGAKDFIKYAQSKNIEIVFISNRFDFLVEDSILNLQNLGITSIKENYLFSNGQWSKEDRRLSVKKKYDIILYFGDSLGDFHSDFDNKDSDERRALVDKHQSEFGAKFIILPNPLYGDWENSLPSSKNKADLLITD